MDVSKSPSLTTDGTIASSFKGLALFTPGGDCVYCVDQRKRDRWHLDLCAALQRALVLVEPPYFLLPCFTATVDRWVDSASQQPLTVAEAYPRALPFQPLLNTLFGLGPLVWQPNYTHREECSVGVIESYRSIFPQLWESHDLILRVEATPSRSVSLAGLDQASQAASQPYGFKLFVSGADTLATEKMLRTLHQTLETTLVVPYTLQVIDVLKHPAEAEVEHVSATPTLIQVSPLPTRRIVGQLPNPSQIRELLGQG